jgi:signal transduction histidine kinase
MPRRNDPSEELLRLQRDANEKLVLAGIRANEVADEALGALQHAVREASAREEALRTTAEFRERLIGIVGHDLRSPLNTMLMASGLLIARGGLSQEDARLASRIVTSGQRMARMISQLVEFTRARLGGDFELKRSRKDLGDICKDIAEELRIGASTEIHLLRDGDLVGTWDADRLAEAVSNLANNAVDFATPGTPVVIHAHGDGDGVVVEVTNQGPCISPEVLPVIFDAFRRGPASKSARSGNLGLGLYIASEIVRAHGGTLTARSSDGTTTFTLRLPR